jgi:DNA-binding transcriptional MocR family regulator
VELTFLTQGLPNAQFFPFDTLEAQAAKPERWLPSQTSPSNTLGDGPRLSQAAVASHIAVPKASGEDDVMKRIDVSTALQYGLAQGYPPLLSWVRQFARENLHPDVPYKGGPEVSMTCGSTDAFAKILHLFVNPWNDGLDDVRDRPGLLCEKLVYGVPLAEALPRGMQVVPIEADTSGMLVSGPGGLEDILSNWDSTKGRRPHLMYTVTYVAR